MHAHIPDRLGRLNGCSGCHIAERALVELLVLLLFALFVCVLCALTYTRSHNRFQKKTLNQLFGVDMQRGRVKTNESLGICWKLDFNGVSSSQQYCAVV